MPRGSTTRCSYLDSGTESPVEDICRGTCGKSGNDVLPHHLLHEQILSRWLRLVERPPEGKQRGCSISMGLRIVHPIAKAPSGIDRSNRLLGAIELSSRERIAVSLKAINLTLGDVVCERPRRLIEKMRVFDMRRAEVRAGIGRDGAPDGWEVRPWLFLRQEAFRYMQQKLSANLHARMTALEATAYPWTYEPARKNGEEPHGTCLATGMNIWRRR
jgi:hypothetical protein